MAEPKVKKVTAKEPETFKYGVEDIANALKIKPASARIQLRKGNIEKAGKSYGWNSKTDVDAVVKKLQASSEPKATAKKPEAKKAEVKKTEAKKPVKVVEKKVAD